MLLITFAPITELRGGIPLGISLGLEPLFTFFVAITANIILFFPVVLVLHLFYDGLLSRWGLFNRYLERIRSKAGPRVEKYGFPGLALLVAIPLPTTGVYTATILCWLLGMDWRKAFLPISVGVVVAGVIVLLATLGVIGGVNLFTAG